MDKITLILSDIIWVMFLTFLFLFFIFSLIEKEFKALKRAGIFFIISVFIFLIKIKTGFLTSDILTIVIFSLFMFLSFAYKRKSLPIKIIFSKERFDERDIVFSRSDYKPGTREYEEYYKMHPEKEEFDKRLRELPDVCEGGSLFEKLHSPICISEFQLLERLLPCVDGKVSDKKIKVQPEKITDKIKGLAKYLGADLVGICKLDERYFYSHVGRGPEKWGKEIKLKHKYGIVFAVQMKYEMVSNAPFTPTVIETGKRYLECAFIGIVIANYIRNLGYSARAHIAGSNYQAILPPLAYLAGLGELGRIGILVTEDYGPRVRLGLVTTDMSLVPDKPKNFGVQDFCNFCKKCALNCPSGAIPAGDKKIIRGVEKWQMEPEKCYHLWRKMGTDCAICVYSCPYSKENNFFHLLIRKYSKLSGFSRRICFIGDDLFYGKRPRKKIYPEWMKT